MLVVYYSWVGAFDWVMQRLDASGLRPALDDLVLNQHIPVLGICVGMQMMANRSEEGRLPGLGWIPGEVKRFDEALLPFNGRLPHMGWNDVVPEANSLFSGISTARFYFLHSYYFSPALNTCVIANSEHGSRFASAVCRDNVFGVQFHPEKSHDWGVRLLQNFAQHHL